MDETLNSLIEVAVGTLGAIAMGIGLVLLFCGSQPMDVGKPEVNLSRGALATEVPLEKIAALLEDVGSESRPIV